MKYFFILFILFLPFNSFTEEKKLEHFCKMDTKFYETDKNEIKIFDKEVKRYLFSLEIILNNEKALVGHFLNEKMINTFTFNKITRYAKYSNTYYNKQGGGQIGVGVCFPKTV
jgi:hypothetical protein